MSGVNPTPQFLAQRCRDLNADLKKRDAEIATLKRELAAWRNGTPPAAGSAVLFNGIVFRGTCSCDPGEDFSPGYKCYHCGEALIDEKTDREHYRMHH